MSEQSGLRLAMSTGRLGGYYSRSASDKYTRIIEKTGSQNEGAFQCSINGTSSSGKFLESLANEREAVCAYLASGFLDQSVYY